MQEFYKEHILYMKSAEKKLVKISKKVSRATVVSRIKAPESMVRKLTADGFEATAENALLEESDAIGIRIITESLSDVYKVFEKLKKQVKILNVKDFIKEPKESGYMSLHLIVSVKTKDPEIREYKAEIQIRTAIMDCWASLEHLVKYKQVTEMTPEIMDILETYRTEAEKEVKNARR